MKKLSSISVLAMIAICLGNLERASGDIVHFQFTGTFNSTSVLYNAGDAYSGYYRLDSTAPTNPHPDSTLNITSIAISPDLPGTGWEMVVHSSLISPFTVTGNRGQISIGNDTAFGDRYIATLHDTSPIILPTGLTLNFFQIDMQDHNSAGADMLVDEDLASMPNLALANHAGGRFYIQDPPSGCSQCQHQMNTLAVPEPGSFALITVLALGLLTGFARRRTTFIAATSASNRAAAN